MILFRYSLTALVLLGQSLPLIAQSGSEPAITELRVTARLREERLQDVPAAVSVVGGNWLDSAYAVNTRELGTLVPTLYYNSANPRNTAYTIRGMGSNTLSISAANDGMEPGVGFYVDGVYHGRPATAAFDFTDVERVEVLRGPQGTLFGKNTTGGAIHISSRPPAFRPEANAELSMGESGFRQTRASITGPLLEKLAGRMSVQTTRRDGLIRNVNTGQKLNSLDNYALRGQLLYEADDGFSARLIADVSNLDSDCCTQIFLRVGESLRSPTRQFPALAAGLGYAPPSRDVYDRLSDIDADLHVDTQDGGVSLHLDKALDAVTLTSISAWRYWKWDVANDRDYTGIPIQGVQRIPSRQDQWSQELRLSSRDDQALRYVAGLYYFSQQISGRPTSIYGPEAAYWLLNPASFSVSIPRDLLDGYGQIGDSDFEMDSAAVYGEVNYDLSTSLTATVGLRYTLEDKHGSYSTDVFGGLDLSGRPDAAELQRAKLSIFRPQGDRVSNRDGNFSGRANLAYRINDALMTYASFARGYKSGGLNMSGLPRDVQNRPVLSTAQIEDELNRTVEAGIKSSLPGGLGTFNVAAYATAVEDYQTNIVSSTETAALRSYPANIPEVRVRGLEADLAVSPMRGLLLRASLAYAHGRYQDYPAGPCALEVQTGSTSACDLTGLALPGLSPWVGSLGTDWRVPAAGGEWHWHLDAMARSGYNSSGAVSRYAEIPGYALVNASFGYRSERGWMLDLFARNLLDRDYLTALTFQTGNSGLVLGQPGDPRLLGATLRMNL
ncbi:MAG: TonB-dependent receptor [Pseudomonadales bacterium]|nr:TonB-dependent receptor [Pseudomonadales bacterium]